MTKANPGRMLAVSALMLCASAVSGATYVYVSNAEDGDIGSYTLKADGSLQPGPRVEAGKVVMPMAVSPDRRFLFAAIRSKPFTVLTYGIDRQTGARHIIVANDNRFVYLLNELTATVTTLALDAKTGLLTEVGTASALPADTKLMPGAPRGAIGAPGGPPPRNTDNDIWASDLHLTPNGKFLYAAERTSSSIGAFSVDAASGKLSYLASTPTEKQPRGFAIDPKGRFMVVSGEKSDSISVYAIDPASGGLTAVHKVATGKGSNWVEIVSFD